MRFSVYAFVYLVLGGCSGQNIVAGDDKNHAEQLESSLPSFCASLCTRLRACPTEECSCDGDVCDCSATVDSKCEAQCADYFSPYVGHGEACAELGQRLESCLGRMTCDDLGSGDPCSVSAAEEALCPKPQGEDTVNVYPSGGPGSSTGTTGPNGAASGGPIAVVLCTQSNGGGPAGPANGSTVVCEAEYSGCSDGHEYSWICAQDTEGRRGCTCFQDQTVVGAFAPGASCPSLSEANAGCKWGLTQ